LVCPWRYILGHDVLRATLALALPSFLATRESTLDHRDSNLFRSALWDLRKSDELELAADSKHTVIETVGWPISCLGWFVTNVIQTLEQLGNAQSIFPFQAIHDSAGSVCHEGIDRWVLARSMDSDS
jgi:hypothetical protein